jgi:hypothetical protein
MIVSSSGVLMLVLTSVSGVMHPQIVTILHTTDKNTIAPTDGIE